MQCSHEGKIVSIKCVSPLRTCPNMTIIKVIQNVDFTCILILLPPTSYISIRQYHNFWIIAQVPLTWPPSRCFIILDILMGQNQIKVDETGHSLMSQSETKWGLARERKFLWTLGVNHRIRN